MSGCRDAFERDGGLFRRASNCVRGAFEQAEQVSPKTVDNVLGRVYRKLGIASRAQLGTLLAKERGAAVNR